jgi:ankyrin repeat protein
LTGVELFTLAKFATPNFADKLLARGVHIDRAMGPEGQTVWHAVVETHEQPERMFGWLLLYSAKSCNIRSSNGNTPLMLAAQLGRVDAVVWLSRHSDLRVTNDLNGLTAPELIAKCQRNESIAMFKIILGSMTLDKRSGRELARNCHARSTMASALIRGGS